MAASAWTPVDESKTASAWTPVEEAKPAAKPSFFSDPKAYLQNQSQEMGQAAQNQQNQAFGPESQGKSIFSQLGHRLASLGPETVGVIDKLVAGGMDWKNALIAAAGAVDPAIPAAYFGTQGAAQLSGLTPGVNAGDKSPENVQNALLAGSAVAGAAGASGSANAGRAFNPKPAISRALLLGRTPAGAYESALRPPVTMSPEDRASIVQTGLSEKLPVSASSLKTISDRIDGVNAAISQQIQNGTRQGVTIDPQSVAARTGDVTKRFATQVNPRADLQSISASKQEFLDNQSVPPASGVGPSNLRQIPADEAQAMKVGTYQVLKGKYGEQGSASVEAQKSLARGIKEELATQFPELSNLNARESQLFDLQPVIERAVNRMANNQKVGLGIPVLAGGLKAVSGSGKLAAAAALLKGILDDPSVKSRLAISLNKSGVPYQQAVSRVSSLQLALGQAAGPAVSAQGDQSEPPNR